MLRSSKKADQRKQWWYRVAGYSAVAPQLDKESLEMVVLTSLSKSLCQRGSWHTVQYDWAGLFEAGLR